MIKGKLLTEFGPLEFNFPEMETRESARDYIKEQLKKERTFQFAEGKLLELWPDTKIYGLEIWEEISKEDPTAVEDPFKPPAPGLDIKPADRFFKRDGSVEFLGNMLEIKFQGYVGLYKDYYLPVYINAGSNEEFATIALNPDNLVKALELWAAEYLNGEEEEIVVPAGEFAGWEEAKEYIKDYVNQVEERIVPKDQKNAKAAYGIRSEE